MRFVFFTVAAVAVVAYLVWQYRSSRWAVFASARSGAYWFRLVPAGRHPTEHEELSGEAAGFVASLEPQSALSLPAGVMAVRTGSSSQPIETYASVWGRDESAALITAERVGLILQSKVERMEEPPELELSGTMYAAIREQPKPSEASPGLIANRHADSITRTLSRSDETITTVVAGMPITRKAQKRLTQVVRAAERERGAENQAHSRMATLCLSVSENPAARELVVSAPSSLPGLRFQIASRKVTSALNGAALAAVGGFVFMLHFFTDFAVPLAFMVAAGLLVVAGLLAVVDVLNPSRWFYESQVRSGYLIPPPTKLSTTRRLLEASRWFEQREMRDDGKGGGFRIRRPDDPSQLGWPRLLLPMNDTQFASLFAPPIDNIGSTAGYGEVRVVPPPDRILHRPDVPASRLGHDTNGRYAYLPDSVRFDGLFGVGSAGSGKTAMMLAVLLSDAVNKQPSNGLIWLETKGAGAEKAATAMRMGGHEPLVLELAKMESLRLDLFGVAKGVDARERANRFVAAMAYAFPDGLGADNTPILQSVFWLALVAPQSYYTAAGLGEERNVMAFAGLMTGTSLDERREILVTTLDDHARLYPDSACGKAWDRWRSTEERVQTYLDGRKKGRSTQNWPLNSSLNKIQQMLEYQSLWQPKPGQKRVSLTSLIQSHSPTVLNIAPVSGGDPVDGAPRYAMQSLVMHLLYSEVMSQNCAGWFNVGRSTTIYCDELSDVAPRSDEATALVSNLRDKAREAGVRLVFATQRFGQVQPELQQVLDGFGCVVYMRETGVQTSREIALRIDPDDPEAWTASDLQGLQVRIEEGYAESVVKMRSEQAVERPFSLRWPWWESINPADLATTGSGIASEPVPSG